MASATSSWSVPRVGVNVIAPSRPAASDAIAAVLAPKWRYTATMPSIQVKGVPDEVHTALRRRAASAGMSLQEYLLARLVEDATSPTLEEVLERAGQRAGGRASLRQAAKAVRADRDTR